MAGHGGLGRRAASRYSVPPIDVSSLSERVYASLREEIFCQTLRPGSRLDVHGIADAYNTSVAPVRQALARLHEDGLIEIQPRRGTFVSKIGRSDVREIFEIRRIIELGAVDILGARLPAATADELANVAREMEALEDGDDFRDYSAYIRLDMVFHRLPLAALTNHRLLHIYDGLHAHIHVARGLYPSASKRASATLAEHRSIQDGWESNNVDATKRALLSHLENAEADLLQHLEPDTSIHGSPEALGNPTDRDQSVRGDDNHQDRLINQMLGRQR